MKLWELQDRLQQARQQGADDNTEVVFDLVKTITVHEEDITIAAADGEVLVPVHHDHPLESVSIQVVSGVRQVVVS